MVRSSLSPAVLHPLTCWPYLFVSSLVMTSKRKPAVTASQGKKNSKKVKQRVGPLPVTLLSGFLVGLTSLLAALSQDHLGHSLTEPLIIA